MEKNGWQLLVARNSAGLAEFIETSTAKIACLAIIEPGNCVLSSEDIEWILKFLSKGNSLIVAQGELDDQVTGNLNQLMQGFGIQFNGDCVIRPNPYKLYHPKEAMLEDFISNRGFAEAIKRNIPKTKPVEEIFSKITGSPESDSPKIIYSKGGTLMTDNKTTVVVMNSSKWALPSKQPICALYKDATDEFRVVAIGSSQVMSNQFLEAEDNRSLILALLELAIDRNFPINISDAKTMEIPENNITPDIIRLADAPLPFLRESEALPTDISTLIDKRLFNVDNSQLPNIIRAFRDLNVPYDRLTLIKPKLELCLSIFQPATHGFVLRRTMSRL